MVALLDGYSGEIKDLAVSSTWQRVGADSCNAVPSEVLASEPAQRRLIGRLFPF